MAVHSTPRITALNDLFNRFVTNVNTKYPSTTAPNTTRSQPMLLYGESILFKPLVIAMMAMNT